MIKTIDELLVLLKERPYINAEKVVKAYDFAAALHDGQKRVSGEPYIVHPLAVAEIVMDLQLDTDSVCAALLHDTIEDCSKKMDNLLQKIEKKFGKDVAGIVDGITKLMHLNFETKDEENVENLRKMFLAMSKDLRVIFVKLADRLHNMRTLGFKDQDKQRSIALETMHVYASIAHRLGIQKIKQELENLALGYLDPIGYGEVDEDMQRRYGENRDFLEKAQNIVRAKMKVYGIKYQLEGRIKSIFSIYKKMYSQNKTFEEIYDFYAIRIIVDTELDCYTVLGIIHEQFISIPGRFKDYIGNPKPNGYRSLHTTVMGREGIPFEVQIRTTEMHTVAEYGLAAHWGYKTGEETKEDTERKLYWIRTLLETDRLNDPEELISPLKIDLFEDEIFVFTPKGDVINLPEGSTPIDFAYAIHSAVGNKMIGAKLNGNIAPIDCLLQTGQIVEVLTSAAVGGPSRDWLKKVRTGEARNKIRQYFKKEKRADNIVIGKMELDRELKRYGRSLSEAQKTEILSAVALRVGLKDPEELYNNVGYGGLAVSKIAPRLRDEFDKLLNIETDEDKQEKAARAPRASRIVSDSQSVIIDDQENCEVKYAKCCNPIPGDTIIGFITKGYGVSIHKYECKNAESGMNNPETADRWIAAAWDERILPAERAGGGYDAALTIYAGHANTMLADITLAFADMNVAVSGININRNGDKCVVEAYIKCSHVEHLRSIITGLKRIKNVSDVVRGSA